jgi:hypothetical protein
MLKQDTLARRIFSWVNSIFGPLNLSKIEMVPIEHHTLKNVNNGLNTNISSHLETSGGQSFSLSLNVVHFFNT